MNPRPKNLQFFIFLSPLSPFEIYIFNWTFATSNVELFVKLTKNSNLSVTGVLNPPQEYYNVL